MLEVIWKRGAEDDLLRIHAGLEDLRPEAGDRLVDEIDHLLEHVRRFPDMAPSVMPSVQRIIIGSTGFGLFYSVEKRRLIIHVLAHLSRDPRSIHAEVLRALGLE
jgi:plasmid stabilization system protein ParE